MVHHAHDTSRPVVSQPAVWLREDATRWYREGRLRVLKALAASTVDLRWSPALVYALLKELHTDDAFHELVEVLSRNGARANYPQVLFLALAARHSWQPDDLSRLLRRLDIRASRRRAPSSPLDARTRRVRPSTRPHPWHHVHQSTARLRTVKALRSASTPTGGAGGLDGSIGLAKKRPLRDASGCQPPTMRETRNRKGMHHA